MKQAIHELRSKPLIAISLSQICGLMSGFESWSLLIGLLFVWFPNDKRFRLVSFIALVVGFWMAPRPPASFVSASTVYVGEAKIVQSPRPSRLGERCIVEFEGKRYVMFYDRGIFLAHRDEIWVNGRLSPISETSYEYWRRQGVSGYLTAKEIRRTQSGSRAAEAGQQARRSFVALVNRSLDPYSASIINALCFNHDVQLSAEATEALRNSGTIHIVSTSGLHVVLLAGMLTALFRYVPIPNWLKVSILLVILLLYCFASGMRPPMVRSMLMIAPWLVAYVFQREADALSTIGLSSIVTLLWLPESIWDVGFQLSFLAVTGLVLYAPWNLYSDESIGRRIRSHSLSVAQSSLVATLATAPVLAFVFGRFSLVGVIANLAIAPIVPVVTLAALFSWLISGFALPVSHFLLTWIAAPLSGWILLCAEFFSKWPLSRVDVPHFHPLWLVIYYLFFFSFWRPQKRPLR